MRHQVSDLTRRQVLAGLGALAASPALDSPALAGACPDPDPAPA